MVAYYDIRCVRCGKFCVPYDQLTRYGCTDPEAPEPRDPEFYCKKCAKAEELWWNALFASGKYDHGDWVKSNAEIKAAKKHNLKWVRLQGISQYVKSEDKEIKIIKKHVDKKEEKV